MKTGTAIIIAAGLAVVGGVAYLMVRKPSAQSAAGLPLGRAPQVQAPPSIPPSAPVSKPWYESVDWGGVINAGAKIGGAIADNASDDSGE